MAQTQQNDFPKIADIPCPPPFQNVHEILTLQKYPSPCCVLLRFVFLSGASAKKSILSRSSSSSLLVYCNEVLGNIPSRAWRLGRSKTQSRCTSI